MATGRIVGVPTPRVEGVGKVTGEAVSVHQGSIEPHSGAPSRLRLRQWRLRCLQAHGLSLRRPGGGGLYNMPHHLSEERVVYTNKVPCGHMRAPGDPQGFFATESQMDAVARELGMDPVGFRKINLMHDGDESPTGHVIHHIKAEETLDEAVAESGYGTPKDANTGRGVAVAQWLPLGGECYAFVTIDTDGTVTVSCAAMDQGSGTCTVLRQLVAEELQLPLESVNLETLDSTQVLKDQGLGGSRGTRIYGNAACRAVTAASMSIGETPIIPFAAAAANAVADAIGSRVRSLPVTAEKVLSRMSK